MYKLYELEHLSLERLLRLESNADYLRLSEDEIKAIRLLKELHQLPSQPTSTPPAQEAPKGFVQWLFDGSKRIINRVPEKKPVTIQEQLEQLRKKMDRDAAPVFSTHSPADRHSVREHTAREYGRPDEAVRTAPHSQTRTSDSGTSRQDDGFGMVLGLAAVALLVEEQQNRPDSSSSDYGNTSSYNPN